MNLECNNNCDYLNRLKDLNSGKELAYGKAKLLSYKNYGLWDGKENFNISKIKKIYKMFKKNLYILKEDFNIHWVDVNDLIYTTKGKIWDWTSQEEYTRVKQDILQNGLYFPIFVLPKGLLHNQIESQEKIEELQKLNKYNSYNGNHRIEILQDLAKENDNFKEALIVEIPPFCEKSCTGFNYTPIDYLYNNKLTSFKLKKPVKLYHLDCLEEEMKMYNMKNKKSTKIPQISLVEVDDYNTAFRILTEFQNCLETPLTEYYKRYKTLPNIHNKIFNNKQSWEKFLNRKNIKKERKNGLQI